MSQSTSGESEIGRHSATALELVLADLATVFFTADLTAGAIGPTFSLYAKSLGSSLALIGLLAACSAGVPLFASVPLGALSDAKGRGLILLAGVILEGIACALFTAVSAPWQLILPNVLFGFGVVASLSIGPAYVGDIFDGRARRRGIAVYTIAMGSGYAVGSALAGYSAGHIGFLLTYRILGAICIAIGATAFLRFRKHPHKLDGAHFALTEPPSAQPRVRDNRSAMASLGNAAFGLSFVGAISVFLPVYAVQIGLPVAAIGLLFMIRGVVSTTARVPLGSIVARVPMGMLLSAAVLAEALVVLLLAEVRGFLGLAILLGVDGLAYAAFLTSSQIFLVGTSTNRGVAQGTYWTAGAVGSSFGAIVLGLVAQAVSVQSVFVATSAGLTVVFLSMLGLSRLSKSDRVSE